MLKNYARFYLLIPLFLLQWGCVKQVVLDIPIPPEQMAVVCHFTPGMPFVVDVTQTLPIWSNEEPHPVYNATVTIWQDSQMIDILKLQDNGQPLFVGTEIVEAGAVYHIQVEADSLPTATSSSMAPFPIELLPIAANPKQYSIQDLGNGKSAMSIPLRIQLASFPDGDHFYAFRITHQIERTDINGNKTVSFHNTMFTADGRTTSLLFDVPDHSVLVHEKYWDINYRYMNLHAVVPISSDGSESVRKLTVEWRTLSPDYYRYYLSLATQRSEGVFVEPDALYNNIEGGVGNFSGYSSSSIQVPVR